MSLLLAPSSVPGASTAALQVRQHNALTNARYEYSEIQLDVLFFLLAQLRRDSTDLAYTLSLKEMVAWKGSRYNYAYLKRATAEMGSRVFEVKTEGRYAQLWMFQSVEYVEGKGLIEVTLSQKMLPFLFDVRNNFTSFELRSALKLSSKYAKRLYVLCSQWKDKPETPRYPLAEFKRMLGLVDAKGAEAYAQFGPFRKYVLDVAVAQINAHTDLRVALNLFKVGRAVDALSFALHRVGDVASAPLPTPDVAHVGTAEQAAAAALDRLGIRDAQLRQTILGNPAHVQAVNRYAYALKTGQEKARSSPAGLLLTKLGLRPAKPKTAGSGG